MNIRLQNSLFFIAPAFIWGSTWYVIKFQLGVVNPLLSVSYRFILAGILLLAFCLVSKRELKYSPRAHFLFLLQGIFLFGINYWLVYLAEEHLTSGLISVIFSLIIFGNITFSAIFLKSRITKQNIIGGIVAFTGTILLFKNELLKLAQESVAWPAVAMCVASIIFASLGNIISAYNQKQGLPVLQTNTYGMLYGGITLFIISRLLNIEITFDTRTSYLLFLFYLAIFGSIVAFSTYLVLLGRIGPEKSVYVIVIIPLIAMILSSIFESFTWQKSALIGMPLLLIGNLITMKKIKPGKIKLKWKS